MEEHIILVSIYQLGEIMDEFAVIEDIKKKSRHTYRKSNTWFFGGLIIKNFADYLNLRNFLWVKTYYSF